jgi:hypothetical protein
MKCTAHVVLIREGCLCLLTSITNLRIRRNLSPACIKPIDCPPLRISPAAIIRGRSASAPPCFSIISTAACNRMLNLNAVTNPCGRTDFVTANDDDLLSYCTNGDERTVLVNPSRYKQKRTDRRRNTISIRIVKNIISDFTFQRAGSVPEASRWEGKVGEEGNALSKSN